MRTTTNIQIRFNDIDMARHAHNAVYLAWFELGRMDFLKQFVAREHDWRTQGLILARNEVDYRRPVQLSDTVHLETWCSAIGTKSFDLRYALFVATDAGPVLCCEGRSVMVCYDYNTASSIPVPEAWRSALGRVLER